MALSSGCSARPGLQQPHHLSQGPPIDAEVELGGLQVRVPQEKLHGAQVHALLDQVRRERAPEGMRVAAFDPGQPRDLAHDLTHRARVQAAAVDRNEEAVALAAQSRAPLLQVGPHVIQGRLVQREHARLAALRSSHEQDPVLQVKVSKPNLDQLLAPQAEPVEQLKERPVAQRDWFAL
ncbi:MAG TPA: hypothetical protein DEA08_02860 [Planctomycetes bacterium]|nr:hypothetical protein [Planctomycetota bacterium]